MLNIIVRRPVIKTENPTVLVLLHGYGSNEQDLMGLAPELDDRLMIVCIRSPLELPNGGYAWFHVNWDADGIRVDPQQALAAREVLVETLTTLPQALGLAPSPVILGGFSQGAIMSVGVALLRPELTSGILAMSGRLLPDFVPTEVPTEKRGLPVLVQHGVHDPVLPASGSRAIRDTLVKFGFDVTHREYGMGHEISLESLRDVRAWLGQRLETTG